MMPPLFFRLLRLGLFVVTIVELTSTNHAQFIVDSIGADDERQLAGVSELRVES